MSTWPFWKLASTHGPSRICWTNPKRRCGSSQNTLKPLHFVHIFRRPHAWGITVAAATGARIAVNIETRRLADQKQQTPERKRPGLSL